jgi:hypothetical protein
VRGISNWLQRKNEAEITEMIVEINDLRREVSGQ